MSYPICLGGVVESEINRVGHGLSQLKLRSICSFLGISTCSPPCKREQKVPTTHYFYFSCVSVNAYVLVYMV